MPFVIPGNRNFQLEQFSQFIDTELARRADIRAKNRAADSGSGGVGAGIGAIAAIVLAPFTGGASLALLPALTAAGGAIGTAVDPPGGPQGAAENAQQIGAIQAAGPIAAGVAGGLQRAFQGGSQTGGNLVQTEPGTLAHDIDPINNRVNPFQRFTSGFGSAFDRAGGNPQKAASLQAQKQQQAKQQAEQVSAFNKNPESFELSSSQQTRMDGFDRRIEEFTLNDTLTEEERTRGIFEQNNKRNRFIGTLRRKKTPTTAENLEFNTVHVGNRKFLFDPKKQTFGEFPGVEERNKDRRKAASDFQLARINNAGLKQEGPLTDEQFEAAVEEGRRDLRLFDAILAPEATPGRQGLPTGQPPLPAPGAPPQPQTLPDGTTDPRTIVDPAGQMEVVRMALKEVGDDPHRLSFEKKQKVRTIILVREKELEAMQEAVERGAKIPAAMKEKIEADIQLIKKLYRKGLFGDFKPSRQETSKRERRAAFDMIRQPAGRTP